MSGHLKLKKNKTKFQICRRVKCNEKDNVKLVMQGKRCHFPSDSLEQVMRNLQTLERVANFKLSDEVCKRIPYIKELRLHYSSTAVEFPISDYCLRNLVCFRELESLDCTFESFGRNGIKSEWREFGLSLKLPTSLKKLSIWVCVLDWEEITTIAGSLPHLESLSLFAVVGSEWSLVEEEFAHLKCLTVSNCDDWVYWNADNSNFPVLECLFLWNLSSLDELPSFIGKIPTLRSINCSGCSESLMISAVRTAMEREEEPGYEDLRLEFKFYSEKETVECFKTKLQQQGLTINNLISDVWLTSG